MGSIEEVSRPDDERRTIAKAELGRLITGLVDPDEFSNDELLALGIGREVDGPLSDEQVIREAEERLAEIEGKDDRSPGRITVDEMADEHDAADQPGSDYIEALEDRLVEAINDAEQYRKALKGMSDWLDDPETDGEDALTVMITQLNAAGMKAAS